MTAEEADEFHTDGPARDMGMDELARAYNALLAERDALVEALRPFADYLEGYNDNGASLSPAALVSAIAEDVAHPEGPYVRALFVGDLQRARTALGIAPRPSPERPAPVGKRELEALAQMAEADMLRPKLCEMDYELYEQAYHAKGWLRALIARRSGR